MKTLELIEMEAINGGGNRECFIDGVLTIAFIGVGSAAGGLFGGIGGFFTGLALANSDGCFSAQ